MLAGPAVRAGFLLGILDSFASMNEVTSILPGIDQVVISLVAIEIFLVRPLDPMGAMGVVKSEDMAYPR